MSDVLKNRPVGVEGNAEIHSHNDNFLSFVNLTRRPLATSHRKIFFFFATLSLLFFQTDDLVVSPISTIISRPIIPSFQFSAIYFLSSISFHTFWGLAGNIPCYRSENRLRGRLGIETTDQLATLEAKIALRRFLPRANSFRGGSWAIKNGQPFP